MSALNQNRKYLVTGASGLLGREHVDTIAAYGGTPILLDLYQNVLDDQVKDLNKKYNINASGYAVNITKEEDMIYSEAAIDKN